jgi:hypothetical protein
MSWLLRFYIRPGGWLGVCISWNEMLLLGMTSRNSTNPFRDPNSGALVESGAENFGMHFLRGQYIQSSWTIARIYDTAARQTAQQLSSALLATDIREVASHNPCGDPPLAWKLGRGIQ